MEQTKCIIKYELKNNNLEHLMELIDVEEQNLIWGWDDPIVWYEKSTTKDKHYQIRDLLEKELEVGEWVKYYLDDEVFIIIKVVDHNDPKEPWTEIVSIDGEYEWLGQMLESLSYQDGIDNEELETLLIENHNNNNNNKGRY